MNGTRARLDTLLESVWYGGSALRHVLRPAALVFGALAAARRLAYGRGWLDVVRLDVPVVVVGNVTVGGTGKTPALVALAGELAERGRRVGIVTRGYGGRAAGWPQRVTRDSDPAAVGDEPVLLARRMGCPVVAGPDRVAAARRLLAGDDVEIIVSDDGLQHYRLGRAFELAVVDGARGLGNGLLLPAGPLREPAARLADVDAVIVNGPGFDMDGAYRARVDVTRVVALADASETTLAAFERRDVHAVAAIGHPERFFAMLRAAGLVVHEHALPDHAAVADYVAGLTRDACVLMTEKDAVKCARLERDDVWYVAVDMRIDEVSRLVDTLLDVVASVGRPAGRAGSSA